MRASATFAWSRASAPLARLAQLSSRSGDRSGCPTGLLPNEDGFPRPIAPSWIEWQGRTGPPMGGPVRPLVHAASLTGSGSRSGSLLAVGWLRVLVARAAMRAAATRKTLQAVSAIWKPEVSAAG